MKNAEVISRLSELPQDAEVCFYNQGIWGINFIKEKKGMVKLMNYEMPEDVD